MMCVCCPRHQETEAITGVWKLESSLGNISRKRYTNKNQANAMKCSRQSCPDSCSVLFGRIRGLLGCMWGVETGFPMSEASLKLSRQPRMTGTFRSCGD